VLPSGGGVSVNLEWNSFALGFNCVLSWQNTSTLWTLQLPPAATQPENRNVTQPAKIRIHRMWIPGLPHNILHGSIELAIPENPLVGPNIPPVYLKYKSTYRRFCANFGRYGA